jgi:hypothetical protein
MVQDSPLFLAYAAACLAARGVRVDGTWTPDEIRAAWAALRHPVEFAEWLQRMVGTAAPSAQPVAEPDVPRDAEGLPLDPHADMTDEEKKRWNSRFDRSFRRSHPDTPPQPEAPAAQADLKTLDPIRLKDAPDTRVVFDAWADAQRQNAYVLTATASGYQRKLVTADAIVRGGI